MIPGGGASKVAKQALRFFVLQSAISNKFESPPFKQKPPLCGESFDLFSGEGGINFVDPLLPVFLQMQILSAAHPIFHFTHPLTKAKAFDASA
jgi:hypothetical protein